MKHLFNVKMNTAATPKSANGATLCTPDKFAMQSRCNRLKRELKTNRKLLGI